MVLLTIKSLSSLLDVQLETLYYNDALNLGLPIKVLAIPAIEVPI
jgi:hypothetical protein